MDMFGMMNDMIGNMVWLAPFPSPALILVAASMAGREVGGGVLVKRLAWTKLRQSPGA